MAQELKKGKNKRQAQRISWSFAQTFRGRQHAITRHRIWLLAMILLYQFFVYPVGTALVISVQNQSNTTVYSGLLQEQERLLRQNAVSEYLGLRQPFWWIPLVVGVIAAITEFSWLFSMIKMDFYESQPISRRQRFRDLWCNGALLYLIPQWIIGFLGILVAVAMDGMSGAMLPDAILALVVNSVDYLAAYSVTALACALCGNGIVAACLTGFFLLAEPLWKALHMFMTQSYYVTYSGNVGSMPFYFTPATNAYVIPSRVNYYYYNSYLNIVTAEKLGKILPELAPYFLANVVIAVVALLLARLAFIRRRAEGAGGSILYLPLREIVKILIAATAAVIVGYLMNMVTRGDSTYQASSPLGGIFTVLIMAVVGVIAGGVIQVIYEFDLKAFFHELWSTVFAVLLGCLVLAVFAFDLTGYNRYVPKQKDVAWGALSFSQSTSPYYGDGQNARMNGSTQEGYLDENMHLTGEQLTSLLEVAREGQEYLVASTKDTADSQAEAGSAESTMQSTDAQAQAAQERNGYFATVTYHLNSGRVVSRSIWIPYDVDKGLMDSILTSRAYKDAVYPVYEDNTAADLYADKGSLVYTNGTFQKEGKGSLYREFKEAYKKDLEQYSYTLASSELPVGYVGFVYNPASTLISENMVTYVNSYYEVYPEYTNTLAFLKEHGLYIEPVSEEAPLIRSITVSNYNTDEQPEDTYRTQEQIQEILENSENYSLAPQWYPAQQNVDFTWSISIEADTDLAAQSGLKDTDEFGASFYFRKDSVPAFILTDVGGTQASATSS